MAYPSTITSFVNPLPTDRLNSPSHSSIETAQNTALTQIMNAVGTSASVIGTVIGDLRNTTSSGGGHVQTANKGGTGQTAYTKGDTLVATNTSTLSKLAVGTDGQALIADSTTASGVRWGAPNANRFYTNASVITITTNAQTSIFSNSILGSTLGTGNAIRSTTYINYWQEPTAGASLIAAIQFGGVNVASIVVAPVVQLTNGIVAGTLEHVMIENNAVNSQRHFIQLNAGVKPANTGIDNSLFNPNSILPTSIFTVRAFQMAVSSMNGSANQNYGLTFQVLGNGGTPIINVGGTIIEKIV